LCSPKGICLAEAGRQKAFEESYMSNQERDREETHNEPEGLGEHKRGPASEQAHEQGWGMNEEDRTTPPQGRPAHYGGKGFDYGAQDFGDTPAKRDNPSGVEDEPPAQGRKTG
jgi:hypothetical protein